ncbi:glycosyltransferase [Nitratireductor sp. B36]|uniref:glycosyltransferase n=1 Tax=Nitratireductor sp. B36 TaxID=2762059 RepID=UPI001E42B8B9|nr:glycosyltransferase [Nitratireductor sp. B36]
MTGVETGKGRRIARGVAVVVVTYRRPAMLAQLLESVAGSTLLPERLVIIDNASGDETPAVVEAARAALGPVELDYRLLERNLGGAGGFHEGVRLAHAAGAEWMWLMDDDVALAPSGLETLLAHAGRYRCLMGERENSDGRPFFFQNVFFPALGVALPRPGNLFRRADVWHTNLATFEGLFVHRSVVDAIGFPDPRFFITWDDLAYGWLASHVTDVVCVKGVVLQRLRHQRQISLGVRHLAEASDLSRFYMMRNRGLLVHYLRAKGRYRPIPFAFGTALVALKEILRLVAVERRLKGMGSITRGMREARRIARDDAWSGLPETAAGAAPSHTQKASARS